MSLDNCPGCGKRILDFEEGGYEAEDGQRGHYACTGRPEPEKETFPPRVESITHVVIEREVCTEDGCGKFAVVRMVVRYAEYGFCAGHGLALMGVTA